MVCVCGGEGKEADGRMMMMTEDPGKADGFLRHFAEELRNQARGTPTEPPPPTPTGKRETPVKKE